MKRICVFWGSSFGNNKDYKSAAKNLGGLFNPDYALAQHHFQ